MPTALAKQMAKAGTTVPGPVHATALLDTGADTTVVDEGILKNQLGLKPVGQGRQHGVAGQTPQPVALYACSIDVKIGPLAEVMDIAQTMTGKLMGLGLGVLLGRDFLEGKMLIYDGDQGTWCIAK